jgi:hypothetical protein
VLNCNIRLNIVIKQIVTKYIRNQVFVLIDTIQIIFLNFRFHNPFQTDLFLNGIGLTAQFLSRRIDYAAHSFLYVNSLYIDQSHYVRSE